MDLHCWTGQHAVRDLSGAIQLHRDAKLIDFASLVKPEGQKSLADQLLDREVRPRGTARDDECPGGVGRRRSRVLDRFVESDGRRTLLRIAFVPEIGWYGSPCSTSTY